MSLFDNKKLSAIESKNKKNKKHTILIVDDEAYNLKTLSSLLSENYNVLEADDGQSALELINSLENPSEIHLIITDQRMPNLTGVELLEKTQAIIPYAKSIILTGFTDVDIIIQAINQCKIYKFMLKPFEQYDLMLTVQRALEAYNLEAKNIALMQKLLSLNTSLEKEVKEKNTLLEKQYTTLITIASHDLKKPLILIRDVVDTLQKELEQKQTDNIESSLQLIAESAEYMSDITENYLDTQVIATGHLELLKASTDINKLTTEVIKYNISSAKSKDITLTTELDNAPLMIDIDKTRISQVLDNLVGNAIKFCQQGDSINVVVTAQDSQIHITVNDTGPGIPEAEREKLFTRFAHLSNKPTGGEKSLGLGLYICKQIIGMHQGNISVQNNDSGGAHFLITLPC